MKSLKFTSVFLVALVVVSCAKKPENILVGEWKGRDPDGKSVLMVFNANKTFRISGDNPAEGFGGETGDGNKVEWNLDTSQNPMHLEVVFTRTSGEKSITQFATVRFIDARTMDMKLNSQLSEVGDSSGLNQIVLVKQ